jgi:hypothetical protein
MMEPILDDCEPGTVRARLAERGALLLRCDHGYPREAFVALGDALMVPRRHANAEASEREFIDGDLTLTTVTRGCDAIPLHREASYVPGSPAFLMFYCERPAADGGGQTVICDGVRLLAGLPPADRAFVRAADIRWEMPLPDGEWQARFGVTTPDAARAALAGWTGFLKPWESLSATFSGNTMTLALGTRCVTPAQFDGEPSFCNSVLITHTRRGDGNYVEDRLRLRLADGSPFPAGTLARIAQSAADHTVAIPWQRGDIVVIDNTRFMHGRRAFTDPSRRVLVRMGDP